MRGALSGIFFLSGAAALVFENLWFRQAGLAFGNSVWASSLVLASFMAGLALGNATAARRGSGLLRPVRAYAALELAVGVSGALVAVFLPGMGLALVPLLRGLADAPAAVNALRLGASFLLLVLPTTAMGLTLPILTRALARARVPFGEALGALYGWNTVGAVTGALGVEVVLVPTLGVRGSALFAALLSTVAALFALRVSRRFEALGPEEPSARPLRTPAGVDGLRLLLAAFLAGGLLLALEVVWFRFLLMFCAGSSLTFALLLAVVLLGIGTGGLLAAAWLRRGKGAHRWLGALLCGAGLLVVSQYAGFNGILPRLGGLYFLEPGPIALMALFLTLPVSLLSGMVFTFLGVALQERVGDEAMATGALALANTLGAMLGALAAGFILLPRLGMERSFALLALLYGVAALVVPAKARAPEGSRGLWLHRGLVAAFLLFLALFPFGLMARVYLRTPLLKYLHGETRLVAVREGLTETALYVEQGEDAQPLYLRLVTNGFSMSSTRWDSRRYMGLYVWLPVALHPRLERALLVSYGVGSTARALVATSELQEIDVVDISRDILELSSVVFPDPRRNPLRDPRVRVHVEDGRTFLQTTARTYDLITSEPPPPRNAGVVNLYSREYFTLLREHLREGGMVTYWLPMHALQARDAQVIVQAFCEAFKDCSLWSGADLDWMLVGTREARGPVSEARLSAQWDDPRVGSDLRAAGLESPGQMGALFLLDAQGLQRFAAGAPPLTDNWPGRLSSSGAWDAAALCSSVLDAKAAREAFATSPLVARLWPGAARESALAAFAWQALDYDLTRAQLDAQKLQSRPRLHDLVTRSKVRVLVQRLLDSDPDRERAARARAALGEVSAFVDFHLAVAALAERDFPAAADAAERGLRREDSPRLRFVRAYALCLAGRSTEGLAEAARLEPGDREFLIATFSRVMKNAGASSAERGSGPRSGLHHPFDRDVKTLSRSPPRKEEFRSPG